MDPRPVPLPEPVLPEEATLTDLFADGAMRSFTNIFGMAPSEWPPEDRQRHYDRIARAAYDVADSMMRERQRRQG